MQLSVDKNHGSYSAVWTSIAMTKKREQPKSAVKLGNAISGGNHVSIQYTSHNNTITRFKSGLDCVCRRSLRMV